MSDTSPGPATRAAREHRGADSAQTTVKEGAGGRRAWRSALAGVIGAVTGLAPHVLHHIGLLAGVAVITGAAGTALFGVPGLASSPTWSAR